VEATNRLEVDIPAGVEDGSQLRLAQQGDAGLRGGTAGNLYVILSVSPHPALERRGNDLHMMLRLNPADAALGTSVEVDTLEGRQGIEIPPGTQTGDTLRLPSQGVPYLRRKGRGDLVVTFVVATPTRLSREQRELFARLQENLPSPQPITRAGGGLKSRLKDLFT
jgi:molecular chaperone DnaJ